MDEKLCPKHDFVQLVGGYDLCIVCGTCKPTITELRVPLRPLHYIILDETRKLFPQHFMRNRTAFFYSQMFEYIYQKKVFRITIMGETRGGKSEEAQTVALNYIIVFNALFKKGHYKKIRAELEKDKITFSPISLDTDKIHANQSNYLYYLRDRTKENALIFGQIHIIDEDKENTGGIGTFSEDMEVENLNNIVAKFCQCEIWITPKKFQLMNTPYGLNCYIKDETNRMNWSLIYKIEMSTANIREQNFLGWVGIALHKDEKLRNMYNEKKNSWIKAELDGTINERAKRRMGAVDYLLHDEEFTRHKISKDGAVRYDHGVETMKFLVEQAILEHKIDNFNETEIERIVYGVRVKGEMEWGLR